MNLSDFKKAIDNYINVYGDKEVFSVINHNTDKHYTICFTNRIDKILIGEADDSEKLEINAEWLPT